MKTTRLLIVEDDVDISALLQNYFSGQGYKVDVASQGLLALERIHQQLPALIISEVMLPDMDGFEFCEGLRANPSTSQLPFLFLSEKEQRNYKLKALELGADDYITKPFDLEELNLRVRRLLERATQANLAEPITGLPSRAITDDLLKRRIARKGWAFLNIGIEGFEIFEEKYGFVAGYQILRLVGELLGEILLELGIYNASVGYIGEQYFAMLVNEQSAQAVCITLKTQFVEKLSAFYATAKQTLGFIPLTSETERLSDDPPMRLTIGSILSSDSQFADPQKIIKLSTERRNNDQTIFSSTTRKLIEAQINQLCNQPGWALMDVFIRYYDTYQEVYDPVDSSLLLLFTQGLIAEVIGELGSDYSFFVDRSTDHHFWIITTPAQASLISDKLKKRFANMAFSRYYYIHQQEGFLRKKNGEIVPLMKLAVGVFIPTADANPEAILKMAENARELDV